MDERVSAYLPGYKAQARGKPCGFQGLAAAAAGQAGHIPKESTKDKSVASTRSIGLVLVRGSFNNSTGRSARPAPAENT
jgi:hypothetical protein